MKKLLLIAAISSITFAIQAQLSAGIKAGFTLSNFGGDKLETRENVMPRPGFHFGGYLNIGLNSKLSLQPELLLSTAGAKWDEIIELANSELVRLDIIEKLSYLSIPLNLMYSFGHFNIHAGPQLSFLLQASDDVTMTRLNGGNVIIISGFATDVSNLRGVDLGLNFGAGLNFGKLGVNARYSLGLSNNSDGDDEGFKMTNNNVQISAMYRFYAQ